ncbi:uncharacterized protein EV420DRAFT_166108 [Desarmillaria tabescens]|uniref:Uncharacterized protein n=1 Tax=Armillaria tabescens TaxID=1929756 RepID=A0AA39N8D3_ARMTA|nr:uncharacterized protein EV420DRAFT_166108 [Desarmillaria tabescens]KAK0460913.1 hypothetical protein EV420DRAFT_166108 [Desarmillaria tabescens]
MVIQQMAELLVSSDNSFAAGVGQCLQAFMAASSTNAQAAPIMVTFGNRTMAFGKKKMASMTGRVSIRTCCLLSDSFVTVPQNAFIYIKSKFGLLNATTPLYLHAVFPGGPDEEEKYVEVDLEAFEELVVHISKLRIMT